MGFLYYIEGAGGAAESVLRCGGLLELSDGAVVESRAVSGGPGGSGAGVVIRLGSESAASRVGYWPERQEWRKCILRDAWMGWGKDDEGGLPGPGALARRGMIGGHWVQLGDGNKWLVPAARVFPRGTMLPEGRMLGEGGQWISAPLEKYADVSAWGEKVWEWWRHQIGAEGSEEVRLEDGEAEEICVGALNLNYRVEGDETSVLGLLTTDTVVEVLQAFIDVPSMQALFKKKAAELNSKDGGGV